jgi:hypothetical protein
VALAALHLAGAPAARADFINIDYATEFGTPSAAYGGAANQPGFWNNPATGTSAPQALRDLSGAPTGVTIAMSPARGSFSFSNPGPVGDERALMDDLVDLGSAGTTTFTIHGLTAGTYNIYTYAWAPDSDTYRTGVSVNGSPVQIVGGAWPGGQVQGITYDQQTVTINPGQDLVVAATVVSGFGSINGFQIAQPVAVPEPGTLALSGVGVVLLGLRLTLAGRRA